MKRRREYWWIHGSAAKTMREAIDKLSERYIATPKVSKHRIFVWMPKKVLSSNLVIAIARDDDYFFGVLHSKVHEMWARSTGSQLREMESGFTYTPSRCFKTFPFPWPPGEEPQVTVTSEVTVTSDAQKVAAIAEAARRLVAFRQGWLHPPEDKIGVTISESMLKQRTLTNLYNALTIYRQEIKGKSRSPRLWAAKVDYIELDEIETLDHIHTTLDNAVLDAYGWPHNLSDEGILERLLALNLARAGET
jgi:hypothetical protein